MASFSIWILWAILVSLTIGFGGNNGISGCMEEERIGLLKLKHTFNSANNNGTTLSSWREGENEDCCRWGNVKCDFSSNRVVQLSLDEINMDIPNWYLNLSLFFPFQELRNLSLAYNSLGGFTGELSSIKLQNLSLGGNQLTEIPPLLRARKSLKYLDLYANDLTNLSRLGDLIALSALEVLDLGANDIVGAIPSFVGALSNATLKALSFRHNQLYGSLSEGLCMLRNLEALDMIGNNLSGVIPSCLGNLTSLKLLDLDNNNLVGNIPSTLFLNLKSLEFVSLSGNIFQGLFLFSSFSSNSRLEVFDLRNNNNELVVDTENPPWTPLFQLKYLRLSNCKLNEPTGVIPSFLLNQYDLRGVMLASNNMTGKVPSWLILNNTNLDFLNLRGNSLTGPFLFNTGSRHPCITWLDISSNYIQEELPNLISSVLPSLQLLNLSANLFYGLIPPSVGDMKSLRFLDLSNNNFTGQLPEHLIVGCTSLRVLILSNNFLHGPLLPTRSNLTNLHTLYLDDNHFSGELPYSLLTSVELQLLHVSNNSISGEIPNWLGNLPQLGIIVMSYNFLERSIPSGFCKLKNLGFVDLSHNKFSGFIPSCANLTFLKYLHLQGNRFIGPLPHTLSKSVSLITLDLRNNRLSGDIPHWIDSLSNLKILLLKKNNLSGSIPSEICYLKNISILDLSFNKFVGLVPSCLYQIPFGNKTTIDDTFTTEVPEQVSSNAFQFYAYESVIGIFKFLKPSVFKNDLDEEIEFMTKSRLENYKGNILYYMSGIDLSQNELTGHIPNELGNLINISTLNLSHNHLTGSIPTSLSNLKQIQSLDLSYNILSGQIPQELTQLTFLEIFSVAHNNLSGRLPDRKAQFATFEENSYEGNPLLCGLPLKRSCTVSGQSPSSKEEEDEEESFKYDFLMAFLASYFPAFIATVSVIYCMAHYRERKPWKQDVDAGCHNFGRNHLSLGTRAFEDYHQSNAFAHMY